MLQKKNTILVIEDEAPIRKVLALFLEEAGHKMVECDNGREGMRLCASVKPELILLDLGLPDIDGKDVIRGIRQWSQTPIIICSVRSSDDDVIETLKLGADDYISKPFNSAVLLARIHANLRKAATHSIGEPELSNGPIRMDLVKHQVYLNDEKLVLTPKEYDLLRFLLINCGKMMTHRQILKEVWGEAHVDQMQYLRVYISQLREKLEPHPAHPQFIVTEPGVGYRMEPVESESDQQGSFFASEKR